MLKHLGLLLMMLFVFQANAYNLPSRPVIPGKPIFKVLPPSSNKDILFRGGVTVGGGTIVATQCQTLNWVTLNKELISDEELSQVREARHQAMVSIAKTAEYLEAKKSRRKLNEKEAEIYELIVKRLEEVPPSKANLLLDLCSRGDEKLESKLDQEALSYLNEAFDYFIYYSVWF